MSLYSDVLEGKIPAHGLASSLRLWRRGVVTKEAVLAVFGQEPDDADMELIRTKFLAVAAANRNDFIEHIDDIVICAQLRLYGLNSAQAMRDATSAFVG